MRYSYDPPGIIKYFFNDFIWTTRNNKILLTFDDGPLAETTPMILRTLEELKIKAVFFCVGDNVEKNSDLVSAIIKEGHQVGCHMLRHEVITKLKNEEVKNQVNSFELMLKEKHNYDVKYFRPPHGRFDLKTKGLLAEMKMKNIMWSLLTYDYKNDINLVKFAVSKYLRNNSIIVLHDSLKSKSVVVDSIKYIAEEAQKKGFDIGEPQECLK